MNWNSIKGWLGTLIRLVLGVVWIWAGWSKLQNPRQFVQAVRAYDATPEWLSKGIGYGLPVLEMALGVLLIVGLAVRLSAAVSGLLYIVFLIGIIQAGARGIHIDCGCFGGGGQTAGSTHYFEESLRDIGLLVLAAFLVLWPMTRLSVEEFLARNDNVEAPSAKRMRSEQGARKYNAMLEARRKAARERSMYLNSSLAVIIVLVAVIGIGVQAGRAKIQGSLVATNASVANGVVYGKAAAATVDVYEDFQCPHCLEFEQAVATNLDKDVKANLAQVRFHMMAFLDASSNGNRYSTRAADAALCASDVSVDMFVAYHNILYGKDSKGQQVQPAEGSNGRTDADFIAYAQQAGMKAADVTTFTTCIQSKQHEALVQAITDAASKKGVTSTPTVFVNGKKLKTNDWATLSAAIAAADAKGPKPSPSPTPSPSVTVTPSASASASKSASKSASPSP